MTSETVWIIVAANVLILVVNVVNSWLLAFYNKEKVTKLKADRREARSERKEKKPFWTGRKWVVVQLVLGALTVLSAFSFDIPNTRLQALTIAIGIGAMLSASVAQRLNETISFLGQIVSAFIDRNSSQTALHMKHVALQAKVVDTLCKVVSVLDSLDLPAPEKAKLRPLQQQLDLVLTDLKAEDSGD